MEILVQEAMLQLSHYLFMIIVKYKITPIATFTNRVF